MYLLKSKSFSFPVYSNFILRKYSSVVHKFMDSSLDQVVTIDTHYENKRRRGASYFLKTVNDPQDVHGLFVDNSTNSCLTKLLSAIDVNGISRSDIDYLIITHVHLDHCGCTSQLLKHLPNATVLVHPRGKRHLVDPTRLIQSTAQVYGGMENFEKIYGKIEKIPQERVRTIDDGETLDFGGRKLKFIHTRGHAKHHMVIHDSFSNAAFVGDTFGIRYPDLCYENPDNLAIFPSTTPIDFEPDLALKAISDVNSLHPRRLYLSHYGRIDDIKTATNNLVYGINSYWKILKESKKTGLKGDLLFNWIKLRVHNWFVKYIREQLGDNNRINWKELQADVELNSQGIAFCSEYR